VVFIQQMPLMVVILYLEALPQQVAVKAVEQMLVSLIKMALLVDQVVVVLVVVMEVVRVLEHQVKVMQEDILQLLPRLTLLAVVAEQDQ
jgi:hypothetical protein